MSQSQLALVKPVEQQSLPLFQLGKIYATPEAIEAFNSAGQRPSDFLTRHVLGDWSEMDPKDASENVRAVSSNSRVFSAFRTALGERLYIITEYDRSETNIKLGIEF